MTYQAEREQICQVGKLLYDRGYAAANDGNISVKVAPDRLLMTPSGVSKGRMTVYRGRPDAGAVVHAHPPVSTAFAVCRRGLETPYLAELAAGLGQVPCTPSFAMLSTDEVPDSVAPYLPDHNALLLANHGALAWGGDLWEAFDRLETVEHTAKIVFCAERMGGAVPLTEQEVSRLQGLRGMYRMLREKLR